VQALAALLIPARIGGLLFLLATHDFNKYVEEVSARPETVKQVAEIDRGDGSVVYGGGRAERAASGGRYKAAAYRDGVAYVEVAAFVAIAVTSPTPISHIEERLRRRKAGHVARLDPPLGFCNASRRTQSTFTRLIVGLRLWRRASKVCL
jgi:hypothetical protein